MDPVHRPLQVVTAKQLLNQLRIETVGEADPNVSPEAEENRTQAASELSAIFELSGLGSFQWFFREFIRKPFDEARRDLHNESLIPASELALVKARYLTLRKIMGALLEREITHRELLTPKDEEIPRLRERLDLL